MKKILALLFLSFIFTSSIILPATAAKKYDFKENSGINEVAPKMGYDLDSEMPVEFYIGNILSIVFSLLGLVFLILTIYAGINWMTAQGNTSQIDKAKNTIVKAIVGLVICLSAYAITYFVMNMFENTPQARTTTN